MKNPLVSIVTVTYNCRESLQQTIDSIANQTYTNKEYVIIDGGSSDGTIDVIRRNEEKVSFWLSEKDNGIFDAMNKALGHVSGDWLIFLNSGDIFYDNDVLQVCFKNEIGEEYGVVYGETYSRKGKLKMTPFVFHPHGFAPMGICHQSLFVRTSLAQKYRFSMKYKVAADYNMIRTIFNEGYKFYHVPHMISVFDLNGFSKANAFLQLKEVAEICDARHSPLYYWSVLRLKIKNLIKALIRYDS